MAKRAKSYSHVAATEALEQLGQTGTSASELVYKLLHIFAGFGEGRIKRLKEGRGNPAKDGKTILVKSLIAYRPSGTEVLEDLYDEIEEMRADPKISKHKPRLYVVSNGVTVAAYDPKENDYYENKVDLLWRDFEFFTPLAGIEKIEHIEEAEADVKSAELMAKLFDDIRRYNDIKDPATVHALNVFMSRLLFCFFAEDTGLFPGENLFTNTLRTHTKEDGSDLDEFIDHAFIIMSTNDPKIRTSLPKLFEVFPYVNGGLFKDHYPIPVLSRRARTLIINCGEYNWKEINPDIFGSMIQAVITPEQRAGLGMHYTSVPNIEKLIKPLFLDSLEEDFKAACEDARTKVKQGLKSEKATQKLRNLLARLSQIKFFDPACGSGNFLIISYKRVRELEIRIWKAMRDIANVAIFPFPSINLTQFYGIEIDEYACETATLSLWLAEHQMNVKFQEELSIQSETLPLKPSGHIVCGNACRLDWNIVCPHTPDDEVYIMGNPPYLGSKLQTKSQKEDISFISSYAKKYKDLDYIAGWFIKGCEYIKKSNAKLAFVSTNSITQGEQVEMLWPIIYNFGINISFAHRSFKWSNNAKLNAGVSCVIIGLSAKHNSKKFIYDTNKITTCENINPYLYAGENIIIHGSLVPLQGFPIMEVKNMTYDGGNLIFSKEDMERMVSKEPSIKEFIVCVQSSSDYIDDIRRYTFWINAEDFDKAYAISEIKKRVDKVKLYRESAGDVARSLAKYPYQFRFPRRAKKHFFIIPIVTSERREYLPVGILNKDTIITNAAYGIYDADLWVLAVISSYMHMLWVKSICGRLETRIRYSSNICYNTFPFPKLTTLDKKVLEDMAQKIIDIRQMNEVDMTLGEMYNPETMPEDLKKAHAELDFAVERIYRAEPFRSDEERLEHLFKLYSKMTKK